MTAIIFQGLIGEVSVGKHPLHIIELLQSIQQSQGLERCLFVKHNHALGYLQYLGGDDSQLSLL